ncbi:MarR family transcriptional regulator [Leptospira ognonensis]|uniref:MarR family transcriptional regulator n=1 Tax=Leptospira ognonensis TaxID=2484945 RepID=A0A4R9JW95_9LEPT|nr:helix-turn-helix domain-containing protein [Leptospira ognonensis]TGL56250.1 MarR family transcriptional regulator [Leptospira ognonensis]
MKEKKKSWVNLSILVDEVNRLFYRMQFVEERTHAYENLDSAERSVLFLLASAEATIPELAFMRNVSRQRMHQIISKLQKKKLIEAIYNPQHSSSSKFKLSLVGKKILMRMLQREKKLYKNLFPLPDDRFISIAKRLKEIRETFENVPF